MGDEEMALVPDVQYGLSSHGNFDERKSLIFVKLTDSSQRAIKEYLKNKHKISEKPNIQFLGNDGHLSIPSVGGVSRFTFSISSSQDMEGSQGSLECAQQTGPKSLESLGAIPYKMRIQANDDVYETTRHRMAVAEENNKNKCTRVIKASGPDIGRKVKVKGTGRTIPPPSSYARHRESTTSIPTSGNSQPKASTNKPIKPIANSSSNSNSSNHLAAARNLEKKNPDIMRRPLKERLIHVLALRPYKKPELYERLKDDLRDRERPIVTTILRQVAYMRDNTYHLQRHIWNDVQEDWPFYTEQERTMLRRRKPQNLTPPGSSDGGSSGSGQSPNSIHAGSPPAITAPPPNLVSNKRPGYYQGSDGLTTKKPRISHYRKPEPISFIPAGERVSGSGSYSNNSGVSATAGGDRIVDRTTSVRSGCGSSNSGGGGGSNSNNGGSCFDGWELRQQSQHERSSSSRVNYRAERTANSDVLRGTGNVYSDVAATIAAVPSGSNRSSCLTPLSPSDSEKGNRHGHGHDDGGVIANGIAGGSLTDVHTDRRDRSDRSRGAREERNREREFRNWSSAASDAAIYGETSNSAFTYTDNANGTATFSLPIDEFEMLGNTGQYLDYRTEYTTISSPEQKRRYKEEFYENYDEYRRLHSKVLIVAKRFKELSHLLQSQKESGKIIESEETTAQIFREYKEVKRDRVYQQTKERFDYLHNKLSHIKRLVLEYDSENAADRLSNTIDSGIISTTNSMNDNNNSGGIDNQHY